MITHIFCTTTFGQSDLLQAAHLGAKFQYKSESQANTDLWVITRGALKPSNLRTFKLSNLITSQLFMLPANGLSNSSRYNALGGRDA